MDRNKNGDLTRVYVAGCGGMLGAAMFVQLSKLGVKVKATDIDCNESWLEYGDVRDYSSIRKSIIEFEPDLIINLAALTDLEFCELNEENSWLTNALGAENLGLVANELNVPYVYISTAGIPTIAYRIDGVVDAIVENHTGCFVAKGNIEELAQAMERLGSEPEMLSDLGDAARRRAVEHFSSSTVSAAWLAFYGLVLKESA